MRVKAAQYAVNHSGGGKFITFNEIVESPEEVCWDGLLGDEWTCEYHGTASLEFSISNKIIGTLTEKKTFKYEVENRGNTISVK